MVKILSALIEDLPTRSWVIGQPPRQAMLDVLHLALRLGLLVNRQKRYSLAWSVVIFQANIFKRKFFDVHSCIAKLATEVLCHHPSLSQSQPCCCATSLDHS